MEFLEQQHGFVMQIMNFYEYHLNKMKSIVLEKSSEIAAKDEAIYKLQTAIGKKKKTIIFFI